MTEHGHVELPLIEWLSGEGSEEPGDTGLGWIYREEGVAFERPLEDPLVEKLLNDAIIRINPAVTTANQAKLAIGALRTAMAHPDKLAANRTTLDLLRDGAAVELVPGEPAKTVCFIAFGADEQHLTTSLRPTNTVSKA